MTSPLLKLSVFLELTKPRQTILLLLTMYSAYIASGAPLDPLTLIKLAIAGYMAIGGVTALNMYFDRDIDSIMKRTNRRPLPSKRISLKESLLGITIMLIIAITVASTINEYFLFLLLVGLYFNIIGYTELTKRFTSLNIVLGGIAGCTPALGGWVAGAGAITLPGILLATIVLVWQPLHVWFLAYYLEEDYKRAGIPMVSINYSVRVFSAIVILFLVVMALAIWLFVYITSKGYMAALLSTIFILLALARVVHFMRSSSRAEAFRIFKFATLTLSVVFLLIPLEVLVLRLFVILW